MEEVDCRTRANLALEHRNRFGCPHVVSEQNGDKGGVGMTHPGVERAGQFAALVLDESDPGIGELRRQDRFDRVASRRLDDDERAPGWRRLLL